MTEEQQRVYYAVQDVVKILSKSVDALYKLFNKVVDIVKEVIEPIAEWCQSVCKQVKKYNCNNWRRNHGLPLIHRNKKCRYRQDIHQRIL